MIEVSPPMDTCTSGDDLIVKARKPYTITKQREKWTEEEHNRFLQALKLYGRAWQKIEEHIGTKTAVQIRSHAQKFFSKLEKEAVTKGIALGKTLEIEIPPPRPKRKPHTPYPRKASASVATSSTGVKDNKTATSSLYHHGKQLLDIDNYSRSETAGTEKSARDKEIQDEHNCSEVLSLFRDITCNSISSESKSTARPSGVATSSCITRELVPISKEINDQSAMDESCSTMEPKKNHTDVNYVDLGNGVNINHDEKPKRMKAELKREGTSVKDERKANHSRLCHAPVNTSDTCSETCISNQSPIVNPFSINYQVGGLHEDPNLFKNPVSSVTVEQHCNSSRPFFHQSWTNFIPPFNPFPHNQDTYQSFLNISSTFPNLLVSTLLQNHAAHMAASLAASSWPSTTMESSLISPPETVGRLPFGHTSNPPNIGALAAATVAAACAWWAAHGLMTWCPSVNTGFACPPVPTTETSAGTGKVPVVSNEGNDNSHQDPQCKGQKLDPEFSEAPKPSDSPTMSSESEESGSALLKCDEPNPSTQEEKPVLVTSLHDSDNAKTRKVERSSCGSNTPSSSEVETDALEKDEKVKDELDEADVNHLANESNNRRNRSSSNINDSWKEVSEEGRLAFQALFSREVLPQSFSPPHEQHKNNTEGKQKTYEKDIDGTLQLDLNSKTCEASEETPGFEKKEMLNGKFSENSIGKFKIRRMGFKPYKRCSVEATESQVMNGNSQGEENISSKRIRLEGEAST